VTPPRILVAGIGNVFLGDDGFGVEVAQRLVRRGAPDGVRVMDAGIRGFDLAFALLEGYDAAILVDVTRRGGAAGTLDVIEPEPDRPVTDASTSDDLVETHAMDPGRVLALVRTMGGEPPRIYLVGCEPATFGSEDDIAPGLSRPVAAAVEPAVALVESLLADLREEAARRA
jgi:hydrogenase maturation protease